MSLATYVDPAPRPSQSWVVLCHAFAADHTLWNPQIDLLRQHYNVLRYDLRGHGASSLPNGSCTLRDLEEDALAVMDRHGVDKADFIGLSLGGNIGLGLALRHPERISKLVCCNARGDMPPPARASWDERMELVRHNGTEAIIDMTLPRWLSDETRQNCPQIIAHVRTMIAATSPEGYIACAGALRDMSPMQGFETLQVPVAYVTGELDFAAAPTVVEAMAAQTPGSSFDCVKGASHLSNLDQAEAFNALLRQRLALV